MKTKEPLDYKIGWREFLGCRIDLSKRPLIPREETEFWVGEVLRDRFSCNEMGPACRTGRSRKTEATCEVASGPHFAKLRGAQYARNDFSRPLRVLDLFSGSGCIGQAVQKHLPNVKVTFGDLYPINKQTIKTDIFSNIKGKFDIIFSNPPYVPTQRSKVQKSVLDWEPKEALFAGPDGLAIITKFLEQAKDHLNQNGKIFMEFGFGQKMKIERLIKQFDYTHCRFHRDQYGRYRWVVIEL